MDKETRFRAFFENADRCPRCKQAWEPSIDTQGAPTHIVCRYTCTECGMTARVELGVKAATVGNDKD